MDFSVVIFQISSWPINFDYNYLTRWRSTPKWRNYFERYGTTSVSLFVSLDGENVKKSRIENVPVILTNNLCNWLTVWCWTGWPFISRISSPTWSVACRWIMPPCIILATIQRPSSVIFKVIPIGSSVFFWNCTNRTRVTCCNSPLSVALSTSSPFRYGVIGGGVTRNASSP